MVCTCGVVGDGVHMWCGGGWCAHVVWWEMACTCGVVGDGVHMWCGGRWRAHVVWWEMVCTGGIHPDIPANMFCSRRDHMVRLNAAFRSDIMQWWHSMEWSIHDKEKRTGWSHTS